MVKTMRNHKSRRHQQRFGENINPTDGLINLVDIMLVFACGLLLSLVLSWNVELKSRDLTALDIGKDVSRIDEVQENIERSQDGGTGYERMGTVFRDPITGQLYMLAE